MNILLTGASGFIGRHLLAALVGGGHNVVCAVRTPPKTLPSGATYVRVDFNQATDPEDWDTAVAKADVVVNAVGILQESATQTFDILHRRAPSALFTAAARAGVKHIVQISALGADDDAATPYHKSKKAADDHLAALGVRGSIVQPSLVYGPGGSSARLFEFFSSMPLIALPGAGLQQVQPIHIDDLVRAVATLVASKEGQTERIPLVGPMALSLRDFYASLRTAMGIERPAYFFPVPMPLMRLMARIGNILPSGSLDTDTLSMLERGSVASPDHTRKLLEHSPRPVSEFIPPAYAHAVGVKARMRWLLLILRISIGIVWLVTGIVSLGIYPVEDSYELLGRTGTPPALMPLFLYGAAALDIVLGVLTLMPKRSRYLWIVQAALVLGYTAIITLKIPEFWLHPYGPILKNLPFLAGLWLLYEMEERAWTT